MNRKYSEETKESILAMFFAGQKVKPLAEKYHISKSQIYNWINESKSSRNIKVNKKTRIVYDLEHKVLRLQSIIDIIKESKSSPTAPLQEKLYAMEKLKDKYSIHILCEAMDVPRGTFYNFILRNKRGNTVNAKRMESLKESIRKIFNDYEGIYGAKKITEILRQNGIVTSSQTVSRLMHEMNLVCSRNHTKLLHKKDLIPYKNYVNQHFNPQKPNQIWVSDVTYYRFKNHLLFICAVMDLYSRKILACEIGYSNSTQLIRKTFTKAYNLRQPEHVILHNDRGGNYRSNKFRQLLTSLNVTQSFSRAGIPYDNSVIESFFKNLKAEELYRKNYRSERELRKSLDEYIEFYNSVRSHSTLNYKTPDYKEKEYYILENKNRANSSLINEIISNCK